MFTQAWDKNSEDTSDFSNKLYDRKTSESFSDDDEEKQLWQE